MRARGVVKDWLMERMIKWLTGRISGLLPWRPQAPCLCDHCWRSWCCLRSHAPSSSSPINFPRPPRAFSNGFASVVQLRSPTSANFINTSNTVSNRVFRKGVEDGWVGGHFDSCSEWVKVPTQDELMRVWNCINASKSGFTLSHPEFLCSTSRAAMKSWRDPGVTGDTDRDWSYICGDRGDGNSERDCSRCQRRACNFVVWSCGCAIQYSWSLLHRWSHSGELCLCSILYISYSTVSFRCPKHSVQRSRPWHLTGKWET